MQKSDHTTLHLPLFELFSYTFTFSYTRVAGVLERMPKMVSD